MGVRHAPRHIWVCSTSPDSHIVPLRCYPPDDNRCMWAPNVCGGRKRHLFARRRARYPSRVLVGSFFVTLLIAGVATPVLASQSKVKVSGQGTIFGLPLTHCSHA